MSELKALQLALFEDPKRYARKTDPDTSWKAAESITGERIRDDWRLTHELLLAHGPMTDDAIYHAANSNKSPSAFRHARLDLVRLGMVFDTGRREPTRRGKKAIVWKALSLNDWLDALRGGRK